MENINILNTITDKIKSFLPKSSDNDENTIDIKKTFSSDNIDIIPIIKIVLGLSKEFPTNILNSKLGHKYNELEFFQSNQDSNSSNNTETNSNALFEKFNNTKTKLGKTLLQSIILDPLIDNNENGNGNDNNGNGNGNKTGNAKLNLLKERQKFATSFMNNPNLEEICKTLEKCSLLEKDILAMQIDDSPEMLEVYKVVFFQFLPLQKFNYNETFLKLFYYFVIILSPVYGAVAPFIFMFAPFLFMRYILKVPISFGVFWSITKNMILGGTGFFSNLNKILNSGLGKVAEAMVGGGNGGSEGNGGSGLSIKSIIMSLVKWIVAFMNSSAGTYLYIAFLVITYLYGIYNSFQVSITYNKIINMFHSRLNIISKWLKGALLFYNMRLGFEHIEIKPIIDKINIAMKNSTIINLLNHSTFNDEPNLLSNKGIIIKTFKEFLDTKMILVPFFKYMAYIDVWSSIGKWLKKDNGYRSICNFISNSDMPIVKGNDIWNICCTVPVYNDVNLGCEKFGDSIEEENIEEKSIEEENIEEKSIDESINNKTKTKTKTKEYANLLITGPNGSGKSTYIKSVIECILLGQTVGVVPAREFSFTPFTNIATYLNIPDCQGKESLFQAEMNRCYQQLQVLNEAEEKGQFSFNIMDEIFVSTNYKEGMSGAYAIIKNMCKMNKCLNIITTHFDVLASMDEVCVSKKYFDIEIDENDNIKGDYKIRDGVSKKHMALKLLKKKGFDKTIIEDAEYLYNFLEEKQGLGLDKKDLEKKELISQEIIIEDKDLEKKELISQEIILKDNIILEKENKKEENKKEENKE